MRIIAGKFRGRKLAKSDHLKSLRPTTDKNRESLFNILFSSGFKFADAVVLDVCCGSGAIAFEAISRGARYATLIDSDRKHLEIAKKNIEILGIENQTEVLCVDAKKLSRNDKFFDLVFIDPPYTKDYSEIIESLIEKKWIEKNSLAVVELGELNLNPSLESSRSRYLSQDSEDSSLRFRSSAYDKYAVGTVLDPSLQNPGLARDSGNSNDGFGLKNFNLEKFQILDSRSYGKTSFLFLKLK